MHGTQSSPCSRMRYTASHVQAGPQSGGQLVVLLLPIGLAVLRPCLSPSRSAPSGPAAERRGRSRSSGASKSRGDRCPAHSPGRKTDPPVRCPPCGSHSPPGGRPPAGRTGQGQAGKAALRRVRVFSRENRVETGSRPSPAREPPPSAPSRVVHPLSQHLIAAADPRHRGPRRSQGQHRPVQPRRRSQSRSARGALGPRQDHQVGPPQVPPAGPYSAGPPPDAAPGR